MSNKSDQSSILRDTAVFDYVSGSQSKAAKALFEEKLAQDEVLQREVEFERALRKLSKEGQTRDSEPLVSDNNIDALWARIDKFNEPKSPPQSRVDGSRTAPAKSVSKRVRWLSVAAGFAAIAMVSVGVWRDIYVQDYRTLSNDTQSGSIDFPALVEQRRLAKLTLSNPLDQEAVNAMLAGYQLELISSVPEQGAVVVMTDQSITDAMLAGWRADQRVVKAEIMAFAGGD